MFESLTERLNKSFRNLVGKGKLTDENMRTTLKEVKKALLEADVAYDVVKLFLKEITEQAKGVEVSSKMTPAQALVKIVRDELIKVMGETQSKLELKSQPPGVILMSGLQGSGKTTSSAKLARWMMERDSKKVMLVSTDVYRPAAISQLKTVAGEVGALYFEDLSTQDPETIAKKALEEAKKEHADWLIIDTAGRLHVDEAMMDEIKLLHREMNPSETLFVVDGMTGQDAANTAKAFNEALPLTGVIVTKLDGDARGGAILSIRQLTGKPIKFVGMGEKLDALEPFHPDRMASRILGMGDVLSLVEELERNVDKEQAEKLAKKIEKGRGFNLEDFRQQLIQMQKMGGMSSMMDKLPGMGNLPKEAKNKANDKSLGHMLAMINSMTAKERRKPALLQGSRKRRVALGSGTTIQDVNRLLKQFNQMQKMMKKFSSKKGMHKMMNQMKDMLPPDGDLL